MIIPEHLFRGEVVDAMAYRAAVDCDFTGTTPVFHAGATACGVELDPPQLERGLRMIAAHYWINGHLNRPEPGGVERAAAVAQMARTAIYKGGGDSLYLPYCNDEEPPRPELVTALTLLDAAIDPERGNNPLLRRTMLVDIGTFGRTAANRNQVTDVVDYRRLLLRRTLPIADAIAVSYLSGTEPANVCATWRACVRKLMTVAVLHDAAGDLEEDGRRDMTGVEPSIGNRAILEASAVAQVFAETGRHTSKFGMAKGLAAMFRAWRSLPDGPAAGGPALSATV